MLSVLPINKSKVPDFVEEFKRKYPLQFKGNEDFLQTVYNIYLSNNMMPDSVLLMTDMNNLNTDYYLKRFGNIINDIDFSTISIGDIIPRRTEEYNFNHIQLSFSNWNNDKAKFEYGYNYITVGFVDLSLLLGAVIVGDNLGNGCVNVYGYEASIHCVVKSLIIFLQLMLMNVDSKVITQVWYSTAWSLEEWKNTLSTAVFEPVINLLHKSDRVEYCKYILTGEFALGEQTDEKLYANITMFQNPVYIPKKATDEVVVQGINLSELNAIRVIFVVSKEIKITLIHKAVTPTKPEVLQEIKQLNPYIIVWSNLCDYYSKEDFLLMAKSCSTTHTIHISHFMNWINQVYGTNIHDYHDANGELEVLEHCDKCLKHDATVCEKSIFRTLKYPPLTNYKNKTSYILAIGYMKEYINYYFKYVNHGDYSRAPFLNVFLNYENTFSLNFSFNPFINLE
ncbi:hypothetical protein ABK040_002841 [Willaertia magna]